MNSVVYAGGVYTPELQRLCHKVKEGGYGGPQPFDKRAEASRLFKTVARIMADAIPETVKRRGPIFIAVPNHSGWAEYTEMMATYLQDEVNEKCPEADAVAIPCVLKGDRRDKCFHDLKLAKNQRSPFVDFGFRVLDSSFLREILRERRCRPIILVDNVLDTGMTFVQAKGCLEKFLKEQGLENKVTSIDLCVIADAQNHKLTVYK